MLEEDQVWRTTMYPKLSVCLSVYYDYTQYVRAPEDGNKAPSAL